MDRLLRTIYCERGELYSVSDGNRVLLAKCFPQIEIYEHSVFVPIAGKECAVKEYHMAFVLCGEPDFTRKVDQDFLRKVRSFELSADIQRSDGIFEVFRFYDLQPDEITLGGEWNFSMNEPPDVIRKLLML